LRALQDWFLRFELKSVPDVAEVASIGGMVQQYQVQVDPVRLAGFGLALDSVIAAIRIANQESGGSVLELGEAEYMVRATGYVKSLDDLAAIPLGVVNNVPVSLRDVATLQRGPEMRRGVAELDGEGEVTGGVVVLRAGKNAHATIAAVKRKLAELQPSLPPGVEIVVTYDRSELIDRAVRNLQFKLLEEFAVVALVCALFLWHARSALVAIISLPLGVLAAFIVMRYQGIDANIMSLGGIAIAVGAMVDAAVVMIENAHKKIEHWQRDNPGAELHGTARWDLMRQAAQEVGPALFFSLLIIALSFIPVFTLQAQEGRLFSPLAYTKTYAMAAAAVLAITLVPVLMGYWIRGRLPAEDRNPLNRLLIRCYRPALEWVLCHSRAALLLALLVALSALWPLSRLGGEFMPPLDEGDVLYMPSALPGLSAGKAAQLLQLTDRMIKTVPEVDRVFGKAGRAESATDPAPLEMFETTIRFKPRSEWRAGMTPAKLLEELDRAVQVPGLTNIWVPPIRNRIDMLATGVKSPIGIKIAGGDLAAIDRVAAQVEQLARTVPGVASALAERLRGGRYIVVDIDRAAAARFGLNIADVQTVVASAIGGENIGETVEGRARFPINVRYPRELRDSPEKLRNLLIATDSGQQITLGMVSAISVQEGPPMIRSENARLAGWVYVDVRARDLASVAGSLRATVAEAIASGAIQLPPGMSIAYSGQFEFMERANARLNVVVPATLLSIFVLLYLVFRRVDEALLVMGTLPFALSGGAWLLYALGYDLSIATGVGFIALAGVAAEFGVIMLLYIKQARAEIEQTNTPPLSRDAALELAVRRGAVQRVRPKAMTVSVILVGLLPIFWGDGAGSEIMSRIAAPMLGGMITAPLLSLLIIPAAYRGLRRRWP
jgi:Cu(I)/Ag(I) efflux system membrane protein CusA/SilA